MDGAIKSEFFPEPDEVRRAVQAELHAVVNEAVIGFVRILLARFHIENIGATNGELGRLIEAVSEAKVSGSFRLIPGIGTPGGGARKGAQCLCAPVN